MICSNLQSLSVVIKINLCFVNIVYADTFELPGGTREKNETILETAKRELYEETGALSFKLTPICVYSMIGKTRVNLEGQESYGMLYFADIETLDQTLHSEIESIHLFDTLPDDLTYPLIQPYLFNKVIQIVIKNDS